MEYCEGISIESVQAWENSYLFGKLNTMTGFVRITNLSAPQEMRQHVRAPVPQSVSFPGKGVTVGTSNEERKAPESNRREDGFNPNYDRVYCYSSP